MTTDRFTFENRPLAEWLQQLVEQDALRRKSAANLITDRFYMPMDQFPETEAATNDFFEAFSSAVRAAVNQRDFPAVDFVQNLLALEIALQETWCAKVAEDSAREKAIDKVDLAKLGEQPTEADKKRYVRRIWIRLLRDCKKISEEEPHEIFTTGAAAVRVIESLGVELLPAAEILREMLFSKHQAYIASDAIGRMGKGGLEFYDDLLEGLRRDDPDLYCARALGTLLRAVPEKIPEILRIACERGDSQIAAISALATCGRKATAVFPDVETRLRDLIETSPGERTWYWVVGALGQCGRTSQTVDSLLKRLDSSDQQKCGEIILALGAIGLCGERVIPRLIELLDTFEEYDPDWCYHGEHQRIVQALRGFGTSAASAIPALIRHAWTKPQQYWTNDHKMAERSQPDEEVIKLLGELGPLSKDALPTLNDLREEMRKRSLEENTSQDVENNSDEDCYWTIAIKRISA